MDLTGIVLDDENHPLPNAKVYITDAQHRDQILATGTTGPLGKFHFDGIPAQKQIVIHAEPSGYMSGEK